MTSIIQKRRTDVLAVLAALAAGTALPVAAHAEAMAFTYDALGRLVTVAVTGGQTTGYTYDAACNRTQKSITTSSSNTNPVAVSDSATATSCIGVNKNVLANDSDADSDPLTITGISGSVYASNNDPYISVEPAPSFQGTIVVSYTISDGRGGTAGATLTASFPSNWCSGGG